jgi:PLATZ transcription factor
VLVVIAKKLTSCGRVVETSTMALHEWTSRLCTTAFGCPCKAHADKNGMFFCLDTPSAPALCASCVPWVSHLRCLQVRRYVYRDVVRCDDVSLHLDVSGVQSYTINNARVVFINPVRKRWDSVCANACRTCRKSLPIGFEHCSIWCKLQTASPIRKRRRKQERPQRSL